MLNIIKKSVLMTILLLILTCAVYPAFIWVVGQVFFRDKANGSLIVRDGARVGSSLIAQGFTKPEYFHPRPSAAGDKGYDGANSSGSNLALTNKKFMDGLDANIKKVRGENPQLGLGTAKIPSDMVMASGSGLDPHISPENAGLQVARVAKARGTSIDAVEKILATNTRGPDLGLLGEPTVNVLELNLELDNKIPLKK